MGFRRSRVQIPAPRLAESPQPCGLSCIYGLPSDAPACPYCHGSCNITVAGQIDAEDVRRYYLHLTERDNGLGGFQGGFRLLG